MALYAPKWVAPYDRNSQLTRKVCLDDVSTDDTAGVHRPGAHMECKVFGIDLGHPVSRQEPTQLNPAVARVYFELAKSRKTSKLGLVLRGVSDHMQSYLPKRSKNLALKTIKNGSRQLKRFLTDVC